MACDAGEAGCALRIINHARGKCNAIRCVLGRDLSALRKDNLIKSDGFGWACQSKIV